MNISVNTGASVENTDDTHNELSHIRSDNNNDNDNDNENDNDNDCSLLTREDIDDIQKEPGDVADILEKTPPNDKLRDLKKYIDSLPREELMSLLANITKPGAPNLLNPNENKFSSISKKNMLQYKLKLKIKQKKFDRLPQKIKDKEQKEREDEIIRKENQTNMNIVDDDKSVSGEA